MKAYHPTPIDTSMIELPQEIIDIRELLAKNTHDIWAAQRYAEGWQYGPERNDQKKLHPCLVPYEDLSEAEKRYDRNTATETLKLIMACGFEIRRTTDSSDKK